MRKLSNDELWQLESVIDDGVRYLFIRDNEESTRHFRMLYPSRAQLRAARLEQHKYKSSLGGLEGMKTRREVERENAKVLKEIDAEKRVLRKKLEKAQRDFAGDKLIDLPDGEEDPEGFKEKLIEVTEGIQDVNEDMTVLEQSRAEILSFCIEELSLQHFLERLTQACWEKVVEDDNWELVWESWDDFDNDNSQITQMLVGETQMWVLGGVPFFAQQPSLLDGGIGI
jgi:hypothetical protein